MHLQPVYLVFYLILVGAIAFVGWSFVPTRRLDPQERADRLARRRR